MPAVRCDIVDVYVFRRSAERGAELLQIRRTRPPLAGTWQPVMGHVEPGETAVATARRELAEEVGLDVPEPRGRTRAGPPAVSACLGFWQLEQVHPFFLAELDAVVMSPRFVAEAAPGWEPTLNAEHDAARWSPLRDAASAFMWPGQLAAIDELRCDVLEETPAGRAMRLC